MKNQIIKKHVDFFNEFIKENFILENDYYIFNNIVFKKLEYENKVQDFLEKLKDYYFKNKVVNISLNSNFYLNSVFYGFSNFISIKQRC